MIRFLFRCQTDTKLKNIYIYMYELQNVGKFIGQTNAKNGSNLQIQKSTVF